MSKDLSVSHRANCREPFIKSCAVIVEECLCKQWAKAGTRLKKILRRSFCSCEYSIIALSYSILFYSPLPYPLLSCIVLYYSALLTSVWLIVIFICAIFRRTDDEEASVGISPPEEEISTGKHSLGNSCVVRCSAKGSSIYIFPTDCLFSSECI